MTLQEDRPHSGLPYKGQELAGTCTDPRCWCHVQPAPVAYSDVAAAQARALAQRVPPPPQAVKPHIRLHAYQGPYTGEFWWWCEINGQVDPGHTGYVSVALRRAFAFIAKGEWSL